MTNNWKDVTVPKLIKENCAVDSRGYPVPFVVLVDDNGKPHFKVNDARKSLRCKDESLCTICGTRMSVHDRWMVGGISSAFDIAGIYTDFPVHHDCAVYALKVCPYLAHSSYDGTKTDLEKLKQKIAGEVVLSNPTQDTDRLPLFVLLRPLQIAFFIGKFNPDSIRVKALGPYHKVEFWDEGEQITDIEVVKMKLTGTKWEKYLKAIYEQCRIPTKV